jgi:hypothetical protein
MSAHHFREKGIAVRLYKRGSSPVWTASFRIDGQKIQRSTEKEAKDRAIEKAKAMVADELRERLLDIEAGPPVTLRQVFACYFRDRVPQLADEEQQAAKARRDLFESCFGPETRVADVDQADVDRFVHLRTTGKLYPKGQTAERKAVSIGTASADLAWLRTALRWGKRRKVDGAWLITENPLDRLTLPGRNKNQRRPVASHERYLATRKAADKVDSEGRIRAILAIARYTGRRINSICSLAASDLLWTVEDVGAAIARMGADVRLAEHYPHGAIRWSEYSDKIGLAWITPMAPDLRAELELYRSRCPSIGDAPLFPAPRKAAEPFDPDLAGKWLVRAEAKAKLPKLAGGRWHPYRRLFATELAHVPAKTAAMLGGWKNPATMQRLYQQPSGADLYAAAAEVGRRS